MTLNERIALARKQAGLSQEQLGERLGVSRQAVSKWESGQTNPDVTYVAQMCQLLGVSSDWLLLGGEAARQCAPEDRCQRGQDAPSQEDYPSKRFTLMIQCREQDMDRACVGLVGLYNQLLLSERCQLPPSITPGQADWEAVSPLAGSSQAIIARDVSYQDTLATLELFKTRCSVLVYPEGAGETVQQLRELAPLPLSQTYPPPPFPPQPLTFGETVCAIILGVVGAIILLSFL